MARFRSWFYHLVLVAPILLGYVRPVFSTPVYTQPAGIPFRYATSEEVKLTGPNWNLPASNAPGINCQISPTCGGESNQPCNLDQIPITPVLNFIGTLSGTNLFAMIGTLNGRYFVFVGPLTAPVDSAVIFNYPTRGANDHQPEPALPMEPLLEHSISLNRFVTWLSDCGGNHPMVKSFEGNYILYRFLHESLGMSVYQIGYSYGAGLNFMSAYLTDKFSGAVSVGGHREACYPTYDGLHLGHCSSI